MALLRALQAEALKLRRTLALRLAILMPALIAIMQFLTFFQRGVYLMFEDETPWTRFIQQTLVFWSLLVLPLFITLETALLAGMEHNNRQWKHLFALPISRRAVYAAKQIAGLALIGVSMLALVVYIALAGWGLRLFKPGLGFEDPLPWKPFLSRAAVVYLCSWLIIAVHTWVGLRWQSFVVAVSVGIGLTVSGMFIVNADWGHFWPWAIPGLIANDFSKGAPLSVPVLLWGCLGGVAVALLGGWDVTRRDVL